MAEKENKKTSLPNTPIVKSETSKNEEKILDFWQKNKIFEKSLKIRKDIITAKTDQRNHIFENTFGYDFFIVAFDITISKKAPRGQMFPHQNLPFLKYPLIWLNEL